MKMSDDRKGAIYESIAGPIMDLRVRLQSKEEPPLSDDEIDKRLFNLQSAIWRGVHKALNLEGPA